MKKDALTLANEKYRYPNELHIGDRIMVRTKNPRTMMFRQRESVVFDTDVGVTHTKITVEVDGYFTTVHYANDDLLNILSV